MNIYYIIKTVSEIKMLEKWQRAFLRAFLAFKFAGVVFSSYLCIVNPERQSGKRRTDVDRRKTTY